MGRDKRLHLLWPEATGFSNSQLLWIGKNSVSICPALLENDTSLFSPKPQSAKHQGCKAYKKPAVHVLMRLSVLQATNSWEGNSGVICMPKILRKKQQLTPETAGLAGLLAPRARVYCMKKCKSIDL